LPFARAVSPAGLSSFFEICDTGPDGRPLSDLELVGARGGGFTLNAGIETVVEVKEADRTEVRIRINGQEHEARTTRAVVEEILSLDGRNYLVEVYHTIPVPMACGFGTSAAGALTAALALSAALDLKLTYNQLGRMAHAAEIKCKTGLGTVGPLMLGGPCIITVEPGGPGKALIDKIPAPKDLKVISGVFGPIETREVLVRTAGKDRINSAGRKALEAILDDPCLEVFMEACRQFALESGLSTARTRALMEALRSEGLYCAQNMIGEAVHAIARDEEELAKALAVFRRFLPEANIYVLDACWKPAELVKVGR